MLQHLGSFGKSSADYFKACHGTNSQPSLLGFISMQPVIHKR